MLQFPGSAALLGTGRVFAYRNGTMSVSRSKPSNHAALPCTHDTLDSLLHLTNRSSQFGGLFKLRKNALPARALLTAAQHLGLLHSAPPPRQHPPAGSDLKAGKISTYHSPVSLCILQGVMRSEPRRQTLQFLCCICM